eukprot:5045640-Amphidinium_carterae.1
MMQIVASQASQPSVVDDDPDQADRLPQSLWQVPSQEPGGQSRRFNSQPAFPEGQATFGPQASSARHQEKATGGNLGTGTN